MWPLTPQLAVGSRSRCTWRSARWTSRAGKTRATRLLISPQGVSGRIKGAHQLRYRGQYRFFRKLVALVEKLWTVCWI